jgi:hypothetical protein
MVSGETTIMEHMKPMGQLKMTYNPGQKSLGHTPILLPFSVYLNKPCIFGQNINIKICELPFFPPPFNVEVEVRGSEFLATDSALNGVGAGRADFGIN